MNTTTWIIVGVVALIVIAVLVVLIGLSRAKAKRVSFQKPADDQPTKPSSGDYTAKRGFDFTSGGGDASTADGGAGASEVTADDVAAALANENPAGEADTTNIGGVVVSDATAARKEPVVRQAGEEVQAQPVTPPAVAPVTPPPAPAEHPDAAEPVAIDEEPQAEDLPAEQPAATSEEVQAEDPPAEEPAATTEEPQVEELAAPAEEPQPEQTESIAPVAGRLGKLRGRMAKSQNVIGKGVLGILSAGDLDEDAWEEIEDTLIMADLGAQTTTKVVEALREKIAVEGVSSEAEARAMLRSVLIEAARPDLSRAIKAMPYDGKPAVIMVVGVNGTGKTTTTGKLSRVLVGMGHKVLLGAADTFRAAAADQLETWGRRVGASTVRGAEGADPASVAFDAVATGIDQGVDVVLVDTAGRLHTSVGLMDQLGKVKRVVEKKATVDEVLLVLDATVGQNGLMQARVFRDVVDITGVVLTKLDGTAKGGIVFQVQEELGVPVKLVGLGEGADDLAPFEVESFVDALLG